MTLPELLVMGKDVANGSDTAPVDEGRLLAALTRFNFAKFANTTNYYLFNCLSKVYVRTEQAGIRKGVMDFLAKVQNGKVKMSSVARVKAIETRQLLMLDEDKRREVFDEVPQGQMPEVFAEWAN